MSKRKRLESLEKVVAERVAELKSELDKDPGEPERQKRVLQAAEERARRVERAQQKLAELVQEQAARAKTHAKEEAEKGEPKVSVSDPEARSMRLADGAVAPAWNVQVATANGFIMAIDPTDRRKDSGLAPGLVEKIAERCGRAPQRLLADTTAMTREDIVKLAERHPDMTVYSPPSPERTDVTAETLRKRRWIRRHEPPAVQAWRARMASEEGQQTYRRRKLTERAHGIIKNRGMSRFLVHGREKVRAICVLQALALNLCWANTLRRRIAAAAAMACSVEIASSAETRSSARTRRGCFSISRMMRDIASTASRGYWPAAVSAESITASVPSRMALATSEASARVGRGAWTMDSSIWVAVITGLPCRLASRMICFCIRGTSSNGSSTPRSPRATMIASDASRMPQRLVSAVSFSIFAMSLVAPGTSPRS